MKNPKIIGHLIVLLIIAAIFVTASCVAETLPSGDKREVGPFHDLELEGAFDIVLVQGNEESVEVTASAEVASKIITRVIDGKLKISSDKKANSSEKVLVTIHFKSLSSIDCSGAIALIGTGTLNFDRLSLDASGACKVNMEIVANGLNVDISGAGKATLTGKVSQVGLDISGSGKYLAATLVADDYDIDISGTGNAEVNAAKTLNVDVSGTGIIKYSGDPKISREISGAGIIAKL